MNFLIVGSGFLGKAFQDYFANLNHSVKLFSFRSERSLFYEELYLLKRSPDTTTFVINTAGILPRREVNVQDLVSTNFRWPIHLLETLASSRSNFHLFQIGTSLEDLRAESTAYVSAKRSATAALLEMATDSRCVSVLQLGTCYGKVGEDNGFLSECIRTLGRGASITIRDPSETRDFCFVDEVAEKILEIAHESVSGGKIVKVGTGRLVSRFAAARIVANVLGSDAELVSAGGQTLPQGLFDEGRRTVDCVLTTDLSSGLKHLLLGT